MKMNMTADVKKRFYILGVVILATLLFLYPTIRAVVGNLSGEEGAGRRTAEGWISRPIALGLDLSGGVHLVYQVQVDEAVKSRLQTMASGMRYDLREEKIALRRAQVVDNDQLQLVVLSQRSADKVKELLQRDYKGLAFQGEQAQDGGIALTYRISPQEAQQIKSGSVVQAVETLRSRVDQFGVTEPLIQRVGEDRVMLQMPGVKDIDAVKKIVGRVAKLEFRFLPRGQGDTGTVTLKDRDGNPVIVEDAVQLTGDVVQNARVDYDQLGQIEVSLSLTPDGGRRFAKISGDNVGRQLAIILDNVVYSHPVIRDRISGGQASITGGFSMQEAQDLALVLRAGALPAPLKIMEQRLVGPTLGQESIRSGIIAIVTGLVAIFLFMAVYYKKAGVVASSLLVFNLILVLAALSAFGATLTLPGLAGLALTAGMAIDANVIIYERIRDEIRRGAGRGPAVAAGFEKALSAIVDSNLTTLLTGLILYYFGTGPVRGFAVTLSIGVVTTVFCATFVSRLLFDYLPLKGEKVLSI